jgi:uncharacterized membrane protein YwaF
MFLSLRLAALTPILFISHVFGLVVPLVRRFVFFLRGFYSLALTIDHLATNFAMVMQHYATVNTETPLSLVLMIHLLIAVVLSRLPGPKRRMWNCSY